MSMITTIPTLESERLILRGFKADDFEHMARFYADPISSFYGGPCDREDAFRKFAAYPGHWHLRGYGPWILEEKATGEPVGMSGLYYPECWVAPEITWMLFPGCHGKGFATEGAMRALRSAYEDFGWETVASVIALDNHASAAVAQRLGATLEREVDFRYGKANIWRHAPLAELG